MIKNEFFSEIFNRYDKENTNVDKKVENKLVHKFQQTNDLSILEDVYVKRIPTLKYWSTKHYHPGLAPSIDDFMEELSIVFIKAASKYDIDKGSFNTCLYTYLSNRIKNMKNSTHAKKRRPENYDGPISSILLSLEHKYSNSQNAREITLGETIVKKSSCDNEGLIKATNFVETVKILAGGNDVLQSVFLKLGEGDTLSSIIREIKTFNGDIKVNSMDIKDIKDGNYTKLKDAIVDNNDFDSNEFVIVDCNLDNDKVSYSIEFKDTKEAKLVHKAIKELRGNKEEYMKKIK